MSTELTRQNLANTNEANIRKAPVRDIHNLGSLNKGEVESWSASRDIHSSVSDPDLNGFIVLVRASIAKVMS